MKIIPHFLYYSVSLALGRMLVGVVYIATFQVICGLFFNHQYMLTDEFMVSYIGLDMRKPVFRGFRQSEIQTSPFSYREKLEN